MTLVRILVIMALVGTVVSSCADYKSIEGSGVMVDEVRKCAPFTSIRATGAMDVVFVLSPEQKVVVAGDDNLVGHVVTEVQNNELHIHPEQGFNPKPAAGLQVRVQAPSLVALRLVGACRAKVDGLKEKSFQLDCSGASKAALAGEADSLAINLSGACRAGTDKLRAKAVSVKASGACEALVHASEKLEGSLSGACKLRHEGNPSSVSIKSSGASIAVKASP